MPPVSSPPDQPDIPASPPATVVETPAIAVTELAPAVPTPVSVSDMPPVAKAGVNLALVVLGIAAGSIFLLLMFLAFMELVVAWDVQDAYRQVPNPSRIGTEFYTLGRLEKFSLDLTAARRDSKWQPSQDALQNAESVVAMLKKLPSVTSTQKAQLAECVPPPQANAPSPATSGALPNPPQASREEKLDRCIGIAENIRQAALEAASGVTNAQTAGEFAGKINEHRQSLHTFWIQAAQLLLLNLLLPLLTALFGYIFGTQQTRTS